MPPRSEPGEDLAVPFSANAPADFPFLAKNLAADMVCGTFRPAPGFEIQDAELSGGVILDFHRPVVVDGWVAGNDADDGGGDFLPGIEFYAACQGAKAQKPGAKGIDVEGFAIKFRLDRGFALK